MIEMLKDWVRDLVIIVIFANLLEMLLPDSSMRKYLKLVMGFFILLTVLNPLLALLHADYQAFYPFTNLPGQKQQKSIQRQGEAMHQQNQEMAMATFQRQLGQQIRGLILTQSEIQDAEVQVESDAKGKLQTVSIHIEIMDENRETTTSSKRIDQIDQVDQVKIQIGSDDQPRTGSQDESGQVDQKMRQIQNKVVHLLTSFYNLQPEAIRFQ